ncbi:MAG: hypothetical protein CMJ14_08435 [Pelagibacterales bacterium]|nr:hypothetical protein [Pelagibacterales bacterium]|tara:strand:- start:956 stop:1474 length:519 start_codon:yes stop_codon:yes gene_type:complete
MTIKYNKFLIIIFIYFVSFNVQSMVLDENYKNNNSYIFTLNNFIKEAKNLSDESLLNIDDIDNIKHVTSDLRMYLDTNLLPILNEISNKINESNIPEEIKFAIININTLVESIHDKTDMILGGANPVGVQYYAEGISEQFETIYVGIDRNEDGKIDDQTNEGGLNYLNEYQR